VAIRGGSFITHAPFSSSSRTFFSLATHSLRMANCFFSKELVRSSCRWMSSRSGLGWSLSLIRSSHGIEQLFYRHLFDCKGKKRGAHGRS
jgi:hypothetical protein